MNTTTVGEYEIAGNDYVAIAINVNNPDDAHYFIYEAPGDHNLSSAFDKAVAWASPGL